jgi:hypothetical protein
VWYPYRLATGFGSMREAGLRLHNATGLKRSPVHVLSGGGMGGVDHVPSFALEGKAEGRLKLPPVSPLKVGYPLGERQ